MFLKLKHLGPPFMWNWQISLNLFSTFYRTVQGRRKWHSPTLRRGRGWEFNVVQDTYVKIKIYVLSLLPCKIKCAIFIRAKRDYRFLKCYIFQWTDIRVMIWKLENAYPTFWDLSCCLLSLSSFTCFKWSMLFVGFVDLWTFLEPFTLKLLTIITDGLSQNSRARSQF